MCGVFLRSLIYTTAINVLCICLKLGIHGSEFGYLISMNYCPQTLRRLSIETQIWWGFMEWSPEFVNIWYLWDCQARYPLDKKVQFTYGISQCANKTIVQPHYDISYGYDGTCIMKRDSQVQKHAVNRRFLSNTMLPLSTRITRIYIYIYICIYIYMCVCVCVFVYIYVDQKVLPLRFW